MSSSSSSSSCPKFEVGSFRGRSVLSVSQFTREEIDHIMKCAASMKVLVDTAGGSDLLKGKLMSAIFYEPSTRTSSSFQAAMLRLGGSVIPMLDTSVSSVSKGETLEDTVRCLQSYSDCIVMRHPELGAAARAAKVLSIPLLNAGDGAGEHPTQAMLDLFTIQSEVGRADGLTVTMVGDLKYGRTTHSLAKLLKLYNVKLNFISPDFLAMPSSILSELSSSGVKFHVGADLPSVLSETDILYVTRIQKERFSDLSEYDRAANMYRITSELLNSSGAKSTLRVLHPLPRVNEIAPEFDNDERAAYFRQMRCGMFVRMALLALVLGRL